MNFGEATQIIVSQSKRPDKILDVQAAINNAISILSVRPFARDMASTTIPLDPNVNAQSFDYTVPPIVRYRKIKWMRPTGYRKYINYRDPARVFLDGHECLDVWYQEGTNIIFKLSALQSELRVAYYQYHVTLVNNADTDWMLDLMWPAVRAYSLFEIFGQIGDDQERARFEKDYLRLWDMFWTDLGDGNDPGSVN